jgi:glutamyl-tRNA(Gln) amidotransferase subunit D
MYSKEIERILEKKKIRVGDKIRVFKGKEVYEGILMPRIEMGDTSCLVIKLSNGYNVGVKFEKNIKIEKIGEGPKIFKEKKKGAKEVIFDKNLPTISILGTGGTIASRIDYRTGGVYASFSPEDIAMQIPELKEIANIKAEEIMSVMSEDMTPERWKLIARKVAKDANAGYKGIIVTHGTDTMHYTAAALSFMLKDLSCPVALVGSQRSSDRGSSDAAMNIACAANFVANSDVAEVCIVMHGSMSDDYCLAIRGTKARKMHTSRRDAFKPINDEPIAKIYRDKRIEMLNENYRKRSGKKVKVDDKLETKVALIKVYPGLDPEIFDFYLGKGYRGLVIEATGLGHTPTLGKFSLLPKIEKAIEAGVPVVVTSQCLYGRTHPTVYHNLRELLKRGVIFGEDMLPEVAYIKLMYVLGKTRNLEKVRELMVTNIAGEISERTI